jgi:two-component system sensor histidine kinase YesM
MKAHFTIHSIRGQILLIMLLSISVMFIFQGLAMWNFVRFNESRRRVYIRAANESIAASLNTTGEDIRNIATYIASFESFRNLYFPDQKTRTSTPDDMDRIVSTYQTIRLLASFYPIIRDVVVVGLNKIPISLYYGYSGDFMSPVEGRYAFDDPEAMESGFFYFEGRDYFIYITPISNMYPALADARKIASCIFICELNPILEILDVTIGDELVNFSVHDMTGTLVAAGGRIPEGEKTIVELAAEVESMGLRVAASGKCIGIIPVSNDMVHFFLSFFIYSILFLTITTIIVILLLRVRIAQPVSNLVKSMAAQGGRPLHTRLKRSNIDEMDHIAEGVNNLLDEIEEYTGKIMADQHELYEMEIYALQSQINPHFMNNTLQCIRSIAISRGVDEIADITLAMSELFRYSMNYEETVLIKDEIDIVRHYIIIMDIRFRRRFSFSFDIDPRLYERRMCRMILQPLVENAVRHGVSKREDGGLVLILGKLEAGIARLEVIDNGGGFGNERLEEIQRMLSRSFEENRERGKEGSFGLYNINRRLKLQYGDAYGLEIERAGDKTLVRIRFPVSD